MHILLGDVTWQRVVKSYPPNNSNCYCLNNDELTYNAPMGKLTHSPLHLTPLVKIKFRPNLICSQRAPLIMIFCFLVDFLQSFYLIFLGQILDLVVALLLSFFCMIINVCLNVDYYILQAWHVDTCRSKNYILIRKRSNIRHII